MINKGIRIREFLIGIGFILCFCAIGVKAVYIQIYRSPWLAQKASDQYERSYKLTGKRGILYDRQMREMAVSIDVTSIAAHPKSIKQADKAARALAHVLKMDRKSLRQKLTSKKTFVWIKRQVSPREANAVRELEIEGIGFVPEFNRFYPNTTMAAQVVGFTGMDGFGLEGVEFFYDNHLRGEDRDLTVIKDALGNGFSVDRPAVGANSGYNLVLTIDGTVQYISESVLQQVVEKYSARSGMVVVMVPKTGEILAMAHVPSFNPNAYADFAKEHWRNRAITDVFEPGSTLKVFSAAAAIESGLIGPHDIFFCENGKYKIGRNTVHDHKKFGWLSLQQIIKYSSNIGAVKIGEKVGPARLHATLKRFGFGQRTGIDCPGESPGSLSHYSQWASIDTGAISFGHGLSVSAVQLITAVCAIANDGVLVKPHIVKAVADQSGRLIKRFKPQPMRRAISAQTAGIMKNIMKTVVTEGGTGTLAALEGFTVCGKTGTARKIHESGGYSNSKHIASFVGFTPAEDPQLAILVVVDEPREQYYGGIVAAPAFRDIADKTLHYLNIAPHSQNPRFTADIDIEVRG